MTIEFLRELVQDKNNDKTIEDVAAQFAAPGAGDVMDVMLERRSIDDIASEFEAISTFFERNAGGARVGDFKTRVKNLRSCIPLLQYRAHLPGMKDALQGLRAIDLDKAQELAANPVVIQLGTNFKISMAEKILNGVKAALHKGLSPAVCAMLKTLQKAEYVIASLRDPNLISDVSTSL